MKAVLTLIHVMKIAHVLVEAALSVDQNVRHLTNVPKNAQILINVTKIAIQILATMIALVMIRSVPKDVQTSVLATKIVLKPIRQTVVVELVNDVKKTLHYLNVKP